MSTPLLSDALWERVRTVLPPEPPKPKGGRPRVPDRQCLIGIMFVLKTGIPWRFLPSELGCGSAVTCWRRLRDWTDAGVWSKVLALLQEDLGKQGVLDRSTAVIDSASVRVLFGGSTPAPTRRIEPKTAANATF